MLITLCSKQGHVLSLNEHENLHFDCQYDIHMSSKSYEAIVYGKNLDLLIISHYLRVSRLTRSGCREKSIWIRHVYFDGLLLDDNQRRWCANLATLGRAMNTTPINMTCLFPCHTTVIIPLHACYYSKLYSAINNVSLKSSLFINENSVGCSNIIKHKTTSLGKILHSHQILIALHNSE